MPRPFRQTAATWLRHRQLREVDTHALHRPSPVKGGGATHRRPRWATWVTLDPPVAPEVVVNLVDGRPAHGMILGLLVVEERLFCGAAIRPVS